VDALRVWRQIRQHGLVVGPSSAAFGEQVTVRLDLAFSGESFELTGVVLSATEHGTALRLDPVPLGLRRFMSRLESAEQDPDSDVGTDWIKGEFSEVPLGGETDSLEFAGSDDASSSVEIVIEDEENGEEIFDAELLLDDVDPKGAIADRAIPPAPPVVDDAVAEEFSEWMHEEDSDDVAGVTAELDDMLAGLTLEDGEYEENSDEMVDIGALLDWTTPLKTQPPRHQGDVDSRSMANLVQDLASDRETGFLRVDLEDRILVCFWLEGRPMYFTSDPAEEGKCLEDALAGFPLIDRKTFDVALGRSEKMHRHLGLSLVDMGVMQLDEVGDLMRIMARKLASMLPMRSGGRYRFWPCQVPRVPGERRLDLEVVLQWNPASLRDLPVVIG